MEESNIFPTPNRSYYSVSRWLMRTPVVETVLKSEHGGLREEGEEVSQLLRTVLVPPALRKDTQWLPRQLHLALLILQFSPQERRGPERGERKLAEREWERKRLPFSVPIEHTEGMSQLTKKRYTSESTDLFVSVCGSTTKHTHTHIGWLFSLLFCSCGNGPVDGSLLSTHIYHSPWV